LVPFPFLPNKIYPKLASSPEWVHHVNKVVQEEGNTKTLLGTLTRKTHTEVIHSQCSQLKLPITVKN